MQRVAEALAMQSSDFKALSQYAYDHTLRPVKEHYLPDALFLNNVEVDQPKFSWNLSQLMRPSPEGTADDAVADDADQAFTFFQFESLLRVLRLTSTRFEMSGNDISKLKSTCRPQIILCIGSARLATMAVPIPDRL